MNIKKIYIKLLISLSLLCLPFYCRAMPPGTLLYRTSGGGKMYGYSGDPLINIEKGIVKNIYSGHAAIYIGKENGEDYIVEALSGGIVKNPAKNFVNTAEGEVFLGAKIPKELNEIQQAKVVALAKSLVDKKFGYDFDFLKQKGPNSGEWTCVGLTEKLYESANISNPNNLGALEYNPDYYAINITPDGFDNYSVVNANGDCFSKDKEFSKIARRKDMLIPAPELIGYDVGLENNGERYIFLPYTQFLQPSLNDVTTDITISSSFSGDSVRGVVDTKGLVLRWSLINNPLSSIKVLAEKTKDVIVSLSHKIFGDSSSTDASELVLNTNLPTATKTDSKLAKSAVKINKAKAKKTSSAKTSKTKIKTSTNIKTKATTNIKKSNVSAQVEPKAVVKKASEKSLAKSTAKLPTKSSAKTTKSSAKTDKAASTVKIASYYSPASPAISQSSGASGSGGSSNSTSQTSSSAPADNYPKIATINKIYSTGNDDWLELYNPTDHDFDLAAAGYRLEKAKTADDPTLILRVGNTEDGTYPKGTIIKAHGTYLIVKKTASSYYLNKANAIATRDEFSWPGTAYTIYLGTDAISSNIDPNIVEAVGFGEDATYYQGNGPAPEIKDKYILNRIGSTGNNNSDFNLIKSDNPAIDWTSETENTATSTQNIATSTDEAATSTEETSTSTDISATSSEEIASSTQSSPSSTDVLSGAKLALISKVYATGNNDWIELYNPTSYNFDLKQAEYRLEKAKTAKDPSLIMRIGDLADGLYPGGTIIKAKSNYLIARNEASDFFKARADAIATRTDFSWTDSGYTLYLANNPVSANTDSDVVDMLGFGPDATYWQGGSPAPAISDNYVLNRIGTSKNNNLDFNLIKSDDPSIDWSNESGESGGVKESNGIYKFSDSSYDLFPVPNPISSEGLEHLWHFNECFGSKASDSINNNDLETDEHWVAGKFGCAKEAGLDYKKMNVKFDKAIDINNFTVSFWFKATMDSPRLSLSLLNNSKDSINLTLEPGLMQFSGLPNPDWRYYQNFPFDGDWRQATLVVNREEGYWSLYIDGIEKFHMNSFQILPSMNQIEIGGDNGSYALDELAIWNRALSPEEISSIKQNDEPFNPLVLTAPQVKPVLKHFWSFDEGIGTKTKDLIGTSDLTLDKNSWFSTSEDNSVFSVANEQNINTNFSELKSSDLSLTFWWRSPDVDTGNRLRIALGNDENENILSLIPSQFTSGYYFNSAYSYFSYGANQTIPLDTKWHQLALVYDSYRYLLRFYVDGAEKGSRSFLWTSNRPQPSKLKILSENGNSQIDDLGIWEGALSPAQIHDIYANN